MAKICDDLSRDGVVLEAATGAVASWFSTFLMCQLCAIEWKCSEHSTQSINKLFWFFQQLCKYPIVNPFKWVKVVSAICNITLHSTLCAVLCLVAQWCLTLCDPMDYSQSGSSVHRDSPGQNTGVGCHALLHRIFPTQGLNPGLMHYTWILYHLSHQGNPKVLEWPISSPGDLPNPGIKPRSPGLQVILY